MRKAAHIFLIYLMIAPVISSFGQHLNINSNREDNNHLEHLINASDTVHHTGIKPYLRSRMITDELMDFDRDSLKYYYWVTDKLYRKHLLEIESENLYATIDPLFHWEMGIDKLDFVDRLLFRNTRGFVVEANIGEKIAFHSSFYENQAVVPWYLDHYIDEFGVMPGHGRTKEYRDTLGFDYAASYGYVSVTPAPWINIQFGQAKNFVGDGYRSLLLSDGSFNYPAFKTSLLFGSRKQFQYTSIMSTLQTLERMEFFTTPEASFKRKGGTFHYLSYDLNRRVQLGFFEGVVWKRVDEDGSVPVSPSYYIPVMGVNTLLNGFSGENNVVLGVNAKVRPGKNIVLYGQLAIDDPGKSKMGFQAGVKSFEPFGVKRLFLLAEYNQATPYAFSHENELQNYSHYNQALGHPLGANFSEFVGIVDYNWGKRWFLSAKVNLAQYSQDTTDQNNGGNIFLSDTIGFGNESGYNASHFFYDLKIGWTLNRHTNMKVFIGVLGRNYAFRDEDDSSYYLHIGLRTHLRNDYYDF